MPFMFENLHAAETDPDTVSLSPTPFRSPAYYDTGSYAGLNEVA